MLYILLRRHFGLFQERRTARKRRDCYPRSAIEGTLASEAREMSFPRKGSGILGLYSDYHGTGDRPQKGRSHPRVVSTH